mmetsp:Transcript_2896/g.3309  ORF Transcript_2896/g.3309 Transcript_2896/m.3309 type:complete len:297 (+) Transcript_2896:133-1023(+)
MSFFRKKTPDHTGIPDQTENSSATPTGQGLEYYRSGFEWIHEKGTSKEDKSLARKQAETEDERILDMVMVMDVTASMGPYINMAKETFKQVIEDTLINYPDLDVRVAFVGYRDFCDTNSIFYIHDFTFDLDSLKKKMSAVSASGGGDAPEDVQGGLRMALDLDWRENSIKLAYFIADAPCHGKKYHKAGDDYPEGSPAGLVLEEIVREFSDREIDLSCYKLTDQTEMMFKTMEKSYNEGKHKGDFQFVDLRREVKKAQTTDEGLYSAGLMSSYATTNRADMSVRMKKHGARKGWYS